MSRRLVAIATAFVLVPLALTACSSSDSPGSGTSASGSTPSVEPTVAPTVSGSTAPPEVSPTAGASSPIPVQSGTPGALVSRPGGKPSSDRVDAAPAAFGKPVVYPDGVRVQVTSIAQGTITAQGPGELTNQPMTTFTIAVTNGSSSRLTLTQVVVSGFYGKPSMRAQPVYAAGINDFGTTLAPGRSSATKYAFSIPRAQLGNVTLTVDLDGVHGLAVFTGAARAF